MLMHCEPIPIWSWKRAVWGAPGARCSIGRCRSLPAAIPYLGSAIRAAPSAPVSARSQARSSAGFLGSSSEARWVLDSVRCLALILAASSAVPSVRLLTICSRGHQPASGSQPLMAEAGSFPTFLSHRKAIQRLARDRPWPCMTESCISPTSPAATTISGTTFSTARRG